MRSYYFISLTFFLAVVQNWLVIGFHAPQQSHLARSQSTRISSRQTVLHAQKIFQYVTENNFEEEVIKSTKPVVGFITAAWCGPCKMMEPIVKEVELENEDTLKFVSIDADICPSIVKRFKIRSVPTIALFKGEEMVMTVVGAIAKPALYNALKKHVDI
mmetsp:Transcript_10728/g.13924  ORF Transcript_10728/g.13924 Transcript_10728/m.13924 type:complete len:159 (+) Transcript_10728:74-550(+)